LWQALSIKFTKDGIYSMSKPREPHWTAAEAQQSGRFNQVELFQK